MQAATDLQAFGLIVTAEPYFAVTQPSDVVVMENFIRTDTTGTIQQVDAKYELLQRGQYVLNRAAYQPVKINPKGPLQLAEAENAVEIARMAGAERYAADTFQKALIDLQNAEDFMRGGHNRQAAGDQSRAKRRRWRKMPASSLSARLRRKSAPRSRRMPKRRSGSAEQSQ